MTTTAVDQFAWWRDALAGKNPPIHDGHPQPGYYKARRAKDQPWLPVAIWYRPGKNAGELGELVCRVASEMRDPLKMWSWVAKNPVDKESAKFAFEHGRWPDDAEDTPPPAGHNAPPRTLFEEIDAAVELAEQFRKATPKIETEEQANRAANIRDKLLDLRKKAETEHETEKRPHLEAGRAVDKKYKPVITAATDAVAPLRDLLTPWLVAKQKKLDEAAEAERKRLAAEEAERIAAQAKMHGMEIDPTEVAAEVAAKLEPAKPAKAQAGGARGSKTGLATVTYVEFHDYTAAVLDVQGKPEVRDAVARVCLTLLKAGIEVKGAKLAQRQEAR
jgi:hypothetical protein